MPHAFTVRFAWLVAIVFAAGSLFAAEGDVYREKIQPYITT